MWSFVRHCDWSHKYRHITLHASVKININLFLFELKVDTLRSFYYKSAFEHISNVFRETGVDILIFKI